MLIWVYITFETLVLSLHSFLPKLVIFKVHVCSSSVGFSRSLVSFKIHINSVSLLGTAFPDILKFTCVNIHRSVPVWQAVKEKEGEMLLLSRESVIMILMFNYSFLWPSRDSAINIVKLFPLRKCTYCKLLSQPFTLSSKNKNNVMNWSFLSLLIAY